MRRSNVLIALLCTGCVNLSCRPDFVIHTRAVPDGAPDAGSGSLIVRQKLAGIESIFESISGTIAFITCNYDD